MAFDPQHQDWLCRHIGCDGQWFGIGDALIRQCARCRRVLAVVTAAPAPLSLAQGALAALQSTDGRAAFDWPGCRD